MNEIEEIKSKIDIVELIGGYVQLKKAGRNYKGLCPFHSEKTSSFMVSPEKQIWRCFGACNEGGDVFTFVEKIEGLSFGEAIKKLADQTGVKLANRSYEKDESKNKLYSANELAADFYYDKLVGDEGKEARDYLIKKRDLTAKTIKDFRLGFSTKEKNSLIMELKEQGITITEAEQAGLATKKPASPAGREGEYRDFFWGRLMFPISNVSGQVIGFSARTMDPEGLPKYINTAETPIYSKSNILYGFDLAKEAIRKQDYAIIVEGMMDVIASYQSGVKNVVAPGGTALTENQLRLIGRFTKNLKLAFDIDFAGSEATRRAIELAWQMGFNIKVITIPEGKDAGDVAIKKPQIWKGAIKNARYVIDYLFDESLSHHNKKDAMGRKYIAKDLLPVIKRIPDEIEKDTYIKRLSHELLVDEASIHAALHNISLPKEKRQEIKVERPQSNNDLELERNTLGLLAILPNYLDFAETILVPSDFTDKNTGNFFKSMLKYQHEKGDFSESKFLSFLKKEESEAFKHYILAAETNFADLDEEKRAEEIYFGVKRIKRAALEKKKKELSLKIEGYEKSGDKKSSAETMAKLGEVLAEEQKVS